MRAKPETYAQTLLPDRPILKDKNCQKMPKFKNLNATFWGHFQTLCD